MASPVVAALERRLGSASMPRRAAPGRASSVDDLPLPMRCPTCTLARQQRPPNQTCASHQGRAWLRGRSPYASQARAKREGLCSQRDLTSAVRCTYMHLLLHTMYGTYMLHGHTQEAKPGSRKGSRAPLLSPPPPLAVAGSPHVWLTTWIFAGWWWVVKPPLDRNPCQSIKQKRPARPGSTRRRGRGAHSRSTRGRVALHGRVLGNASRVRCWSRAAQQRPTCSRPVDQIEPLPRSRAK